MLNFKKVSKRVSIFTSTLVLMTAQMMPFFVFSAPSASALDTGFLTPTSAHSDTDWDVSTPTTVQTSDNVYASDNDEDQQDWSNFGIPVIPAGSTIDGVEAKIEAKNTDTSGCRLEVNLSWNNGTSTTNDKTAQVNGVDTVYTFGGSSDVWSGGHVWAPSDFTNANFVMKVRTDDVSGNDCGNGELATYDYIAIKVYYTEPAPQPDLIITKTNNVSNSVVVNGSFVWTLQATNNGPGSVSFDNQNIILDELPSSGANYSLGSVTTTGGVGGTVDCNITSNSLDCDDNSGGSVVTIPSGGSITVPITVTSTAIGSLVNPRSGGVCKVDPDNIKSEVLENNNTCANTVTVTDVPVTTNPAIPQACGLDIAFVLDVSGSINSTELSQLKTAMTGVVTALDGTPTEYSVTKFDTNANVVQTFSGNTATITTAINSISGGGSTNWQDAFIKGQSTLFNRLDHPDLLIFASDGNPNTIGSPGVSAAETVAVSDAKTVANSIKAGGTRILSIGIGTDLNLANMQAVSGPNTNTGNFTTSDVVSTDFATLATQLATFASQTCGGTVTVTKLIDADGNNATTNDRTPATGWTFDINGGSNPSATQTSGAQGQTPAVAVTPASGYSVNETSKDGFEIQSASCTGASNNGTFSGNSVTGMTINANNIVTCTFINRRMPPKLTLIKSVTNNNGGSAQANDFNLKIDGQSVQSGVENIVTAGVHTINESQLSGYNFVSITGDAKCPLVLGGSITLALGDNITCTITNDDIAPSLTLNKVLVKDNGGTATESNWTLTATGSGQSPTNLSGAGASGTNDVVSGSGFKAGTYTLSETGGPNGYSASSWSCSNSVSVNAQNQITLSNGQTTVCTITNDDIAPTLALVKLVNNGNGGTEIASAWTLIAQAGIATPVISTTGTIVTNTANLEAKTDATPVSAGVFYTLSETGPTGYQSSSWNCDGGSFINGAIQLALAANITCTITNDDIAPSLTLNKVLVKDNGGTATESNWTLTATGSGQSPTNLSGAGASGTNDVVSGSGFKAGTYTLSETGGPNGYSASSWSCSNSVSVNAQNQITLSNGQTTVCTITNDDQQAYIIVDKTVTNDNGGSAKANDFKLTVDGNAVSDEVKYAVNPGSHSAGESNLPGYTAGTWGGDCAENGTVIVALGENYTCYITNDDVAHPKINVLKSGPVSAHEGETVTYTFAVTNTGDVALDGIGVEDDIAGIGEYQSGDTNGNNVLETTETWLFTKNYTIPTDQTENITNTVTVCGNEHSVNAKVSEIMSRLNIGCDGEADTTDTDTHVLDVTHPSIKVVKSGPTTAFAGDTVTYTFTITNSGDVALNTMTAVDSIAGNGTYVSGDVNSNKLLDLKEIWIYTVKYKIPTAQTANVVNKVKVCGYEDVPIVSSNLLIVRLTTVDSEDEVLTQQVSICGEDSHTLTINKPAVLGTSVTPIVQKLANTGQSQIISIILGSTVVVMTLYLQRKITTKTTKK